MKKLLKYLFLLSFSLSQDFIPQNEISINYNQIFFKWPQINSSTLYCLYLSSDNETVEYETNKNSILIESLSWDTQYSWNVCGKDNLGNIANCYEEFNFVINAIPHYYPDNLNVLTLNDMDMEPGITMMDFESLNFSVAIDKYGNPLWYADRTNFYNNKIIVSQFLNTGNIIGFGAGRGYEFDLNSNLIFETPDNIGVHHYIYKTNQDTYFLIDAEIQDLPCPEECNSSLPDIIPWQGDRFIEIDEYGNVIWEWSTFDYLGLNEYNPFWVEIYSGNQNFDWTHSNAVYFDEQLNSVFISIRNLNRITAIDYSSKEILWNFGQGEFMEESSFQDYFGFSHQHSSQITHDNNLIFFDNGRDNDPEVSRCMEVDFNNGENADLIWEYVLPDSMLTLSRGECDRLLNNNTLITAGRTGNVIELNENDEIVWHVSVKSDQGEDVSIYRSERILNLYPNIFSFEIESLSGLYNEYLLENSLDDISFIIFNQGWSDQHYQYELLDNNGNILFFDEILIPANTESNVMFDFSLFEAGYNYSLKVFEEKTPQKFQSTSFYKSFLTGDLNSDNAVDVLDIVLLVNIILNSNDFDEIADLNNDNVNNILDIVMIVNLILNQ